MMGGREREAADIAAGARRFRTAIPPAIAALVFALFSLLLLPWPGLQDDEILFTAPLYQHGAAWFSVRLFHHTLPVMLISYLGAFKTWVYAVIFEIAEPSRWSVRFPMVLVGMITICLTWMWTRRIAGTRAAAFTVALLSTDALFILTNTFDWGPVAFQHMFLMGGLLAIQIWLQSESSERHSKYLVLGFFLWGVGLWDKALLIWPLIGLAVATLCVYPAALRQHLRRVPIAIAVLSLLAGALPLVLYNVARHGETASGNTRISFAEIPHKAEELRETLNGSALLEAMVATTPGPIATPGSTHGQPTTGMDRLSIAAKNQFGDHSTNLMLPALGLSLAALLFLFRTPQARVLIFILIATATAWLQMASNSGTGGSVHHVILLWPFPCIFVGVAFAAIAERVPRLLSLSIAGLVALIATANALNTNEYLADLIRNGAVAGWTDASYRLAGAIYPYRTGHIGIVDWGYLNGLRMMYGGDLKLDVLSDYSPGQVQGMLGEPDRIFIQHTDDRQLFAGRNAQLRDSARAAGYSEEISRVVHDNEGRAIFEIFRFVKVSGGTND